MSPNDMVSAARLFLATIESDSPREALEPFLHPDIIQKELPNRLAPNGIVRDREAILASAEKGRTLMAEQRYAVKNAVVEGNCVALEVDWAGTLAVPLGALPAGYTMRAAFAVVMEFRDGRIVAQRNYDCFEPF